MKFTTGSRLLLIIPLILLVAGGLVGLAVRSTGKEARSQALPRPAVVKPALPPLTITDGDSVHMAAARVRILTREDPLWAEALRIHYNAIVMDGHIDTPDLMINKGYRLEERHTAGEGNVDLPRMIEGGLDAPFLSIYVSPSYGTGDRATARAREIIAHIEESLARNADQAVLARTAEDVIAARRAGKKAFLMGLEGGQPLAGSTTVLREFYEAGVRYVTLTHIHSHEWADSGQDAPRWGGLNERGRQMVREMNRLGMLVDLSHVSDSTFYQALRISRAPVICSHSSVRALARNSRNLDDRMLKAIARNGGVVMINFFDQMINPRLGPDFWDEIDRRLPGGNQYNLWDVAAGLQAERGIPGANWEDIVAHIDHAVKVAGVDHVGLGSDFDGVFDLPAGMQDATRLPWITYGLLKKGYTEGDIYKILGGNTLRVLREAQSRAQVAVR